MRTTYPKEKKKRYKKSTPLLRKLHINGDEWRWEFVGSRVKIISPSEKYWAISINVVTGWGWDVLERAMDRRYFHLKPSMVKDYIEKNLLIEEEESQT